MSNMFSRLSESQLLTTRHMHSSVDNQTRPPAANKRLNSATYGSASRQQAVKSSNRIVLLIDPMRKE